MEASALFLPDKMEPSLLGMHNDFYRRNRSLRFQIGEKLYKFSFIFHKKNLYPKFSVQWIPEKNVAFTFYFENASIFDEFLYNFNVVKDFYAMPDDIKTVVLEVSLERMLDRFDRFFGCESSLTDIIMNPQFDNTQFGLYFNLFQENSHLLTWGMVNTDIAGFKYLINIMDVLPDEPLRRCYEVPLCALLEIGHVFLSLNEIKALETFDVVIIEDAHISEEHLTVTIQISPDLVFSGNMNKDGKVLIQNKLNCGHKEKTVENKNEGASLVEDIPVKLTFHLGETQVTVKDLKHFQPGYIFETGRNIEEAIDIKVNGTTVGSGAMVRIEEKLGIQILQFSEDILENQ